VSAAGVDQEIGERSLQMMDQVQKQVLGLEEEPAMAFGQNLLGTQVDDLLQVESRSQFEMLQWKICFVQMHPMQHHLQQEPKRAQEAQVRCPSFHQVNLLQEPELAQLSSWEGFVPWLAVNFDFDSLLHSAVVR